MARYSGSLQSKSITTNCQSCSTAATSLLCISLAICFALQLAAVHAADSTSTNETQVKSEQKVDVPVAPIPANRTVGELLNLVVTAHEEQPLCDTRLNCTKPHQICMNGRCACRPNYAWRNGKCVLVECLNSPLVCTQQDPNRVCDSIPWFGYSHCVCGEGYIEDPLTLICRPKCVSDQKHRCEEVDSPNSLCNIYRCQCKANYRRNEATGKCEPFQCERDSQCHTEGDKFRSCINGTCACPFEEDPITQRCLIQITSIFKVRYYNYSNWRTERILLATIFIVPIVFYYCVLQNFRKAKSTIVSFRAPRPGEQFYAHQATISIQSPKFMTPGGNEPCGYDESTIVKKVDVSLTRTDPKGESKNIKYQRFE